MTSPPSFRAHCLRSKPLAVLALLASACSRSEPARPAVEPPKHLVLVTIDTLRADGLASFGNPRPTTDAASASERGSAPGFTLDELAAQSVRFERAFAPRGMTFPSIVALMTGRSPIESCALSNGDILPAEAHTLAERLRARGFRTAAFTTNKLLVPRSGIEQGFESFFTDASPERDVHAIEAASDWLVAQDLANGPPLFLWVHLMGPHLPYDPTPLGDVDYDSLYTDPAYAGAADGSRAFLDRAHGEGRALAPDELAYVRALYDGEVARIDSLVSQLARFLSGADPKQPVDVLARSLFVLTADHGEEIGERNAYVGHAKSVYDAVLHVPLFVRHPGVTRAGRSIDALVALEDLLPTFAELFELGAEPELRGRSLAASLMGETAALASRTQFGLWSDRIFSARTERWRLVWNPERIEPQETPPGRYPVPELALYDLAADEHESEDVAARHPDVVGGLQQEIRLWQQSLVPCATSGSKPSAERLQALKDLGYAGDDE